MNSQNIRRQFSRYCMLHRQIMGLTEQVGDWKIFVAFLSRRGSRYAGLLLVESPKMLGIGI
jgi:hypothetical protein